MKMACLSLVLIPIILTGCAASPGDRERDPPPHLTVGENKQPIWANAENFGPVPLDKVSAAAAACSSLNKDGKRYVASGYHSKALGKDGVALPNGGFFCVTQ